MEEAICCETDIGLKHTEAFCPPSQITVHCLILSIVFGFVFYEEYSSAHRDKTMDWYFLNQYYTQFRIELRFSV